MPSLLFNNKITTTVWRAKEKVCFVIIFERMAFENDELKSKVDIIGTIEHRLINSEYRLCLPQEKRPKKRQKWENEREPSWKRGWTPKYREIFTHINGKKAPRRFACSAKSI